MNNQKLKIDNIFVTLSKSDWLAQRKVLCYRFKLAQALGINRTEINIKSKQLLYKNTMIDTIKSIAANGQSFGRTSK